MNELLVYVIFEQKVVLGQEVFLEFSQIPNCPGSSLTWMGISRASNCGNQAGLRKDGFIVEELIWDLRFGNSCCPFTYFSSA